MRLIYNGFVAAAAVAFSAAAAAQTVPSTTNETTTGTTNTTAPQRAPDEPGQATQPSSQAPTSAAPSGQVAAATADDVKAGASVYDQSGSLVGKIQSVSKDGAVVDTGSVRAQVPISSLGKNDKGLVIAMTKTELNDAAKKKTSPPK
jgi:hypothetical protein